MADKANSSTAGLNSDTPGTGLRFEPNDDPAAETTREKTVSKFAELHAAIDRGENPFAAPAEGAEVVTGEEVPAGGEVANEGGEEGGEAAAGVEGGEGAGEGAEGAEGEGEGGEGEGEELIAVTLPAVRDGEEPLDIDVADPAVARRLQELANNGLRKAELKKQLQAVEAQRSELDLIGNELEQDPAGFITDRCSAKLQLAIARNILANLSADEFEQIVNVVADWQEDGREREIAALRQKDERQKNRDTARRESETVSRQREEAGRIVDQIENLLPASFDEGTSDRFAKYAAQEIQDYVSTHKLESLDPELVPVILNKAGILKMFGIALPTATRRGPAAPLAAARNGAAETPDPETRATAQAGAKKIQDKIATRKAVTAVAPQGSGTAPAAVVPPKGQTIKERIEFIRKNPQVLQSTK